MINFLKGKIECKLKDKIVIDVHDIGYSVFATSGLINELEEGAEIKLYTHQHIRENILDLYGFAKREELDIFELLLTVSGIGPKSALSILSKASVGDIRKAVLSQDALFLQENRGIGKKTAERIVAELKNFFKDDYHLLDNNLVLDNNLEDSNREVLDTLYNLGYSKSEVFDISKKIPAEIKDTDGRIKWVLKNI